MKDILQENSKNAALDKLRNISPELISKTTHIDKAILQNILDLKFDDVALNSMTAITKILEREYGVDLRFLRDLYMEQKGLGRPIQLVKQSPEKSYKGLLLLVLLAILIAGSVIFYRYYYEAQAPEPKAQKKPEKIKEEAQSPVASTNNDKKEDLSDFFAPSEEEQDLDLDKAEKASQNSALKLTEIAAKSSEASATNSIEQKATDSAENKEQKATDSAENKAATDKKDSPNSPEAAEKIPLDNISPNSPEALSQKDAKELANELLQATASQNTSEQELEALLNSPNKLKKHPGLKSSNTLRIVPQSLLWLQINSLNDKSQSQITIDSALHLKSGSIAYVGNERFSYEQEGKLLPSSTRYFLVIDGKFLPLSKAKYRSLRGIKGDEQ